MNFPHHYEVQAQLTTESLVSLNAAGKPGLESGPPAEFGGSGNEWSPEDLLVAAVADCFSLSFKAIAAASKFEWNQLDVHVSGTLDKVERSIQFVGFKIKATLALPEGADQSRAHRLLEKAEQTCFITNSLKAEPELEIEFR